MSRYRKILRDIDRYTYAFTYLLFVVFYGVDYDYELLWAALRKIAITHTLTDGMIEWLTELLIEWPTRLSAESAVQLIVQSVIQSVVQSITHSFIQSVSQSFSQSFSQSCSKSVSQSIGRPPISPAETQMSLQVYLPHRDTDEATSISHPRRHT